jgi:DNA-binding NarL/FixJ family response regulator
MIRMAVVDDHPITGYGLKLVLSQDKESQIELVNTYCTGSEALDNVVNDNLDLLLVDIQLPDISGFDLITYLKSTNINLKYAIYTSFYNRDILLKSIKSKVSGVMSKATDPESLIENIKKMVTTDSFVNNGEAMPDFVQNDKEGLLNPDIRSRLTIREKEILNLIMEGIKNKEISELLNITLSTVEFHRKNIYKKLEVKNIAELFKKLRF